jgi:hypothetical protein
MMLTKRMGFGRRVAAPPQYVGGNSGAWAGATSGNTTVSLTALTGGIASSAQAGDLVIAVYATGSSADRTLSITDGSTAYTLIGSELYNNGLFVDANLRVAYKLLTAADASVTFGPTGNTSDAGVAAVYVWRGVNASTPLDIAANQTQSAAIARPQPVTPVTSGAVIIGIVGAGIPATPSNFSASYLSGFVTRTSSDTNSAVVGIGYVNWTGGTYTPAQWTGGGNDAADIEMTIVLRPA